MIYRIFRKKRAFAVLLIVFLLLLFYNTERMGQWMYPVKFEEDILEYAAEYSVDPYLVAAIIRVESNYATSKISSKGAVGLMQLMPETANWIAELAGYATPLDDRLTEPRVNIDIGSRYIRTIVSQFAGPPFTDLTEKDRLARIAAAYNAGPGSVGNWLSNGEWSGRHADVDMIPYGETRHFIQRIIYYYNKYKQFYPAWTEQQND